MKGLEFLFKRTFSRKTSMIISAVVAIAMTVLVIVQHEPVGEDSDYLMCKAAMHLGFCFFTLFAMMFATSEINGNRLMRSCPISKELRLKSVPIYSSIMGIGTTVLVNLIYSVFIIATNQPSVNISDMIIVSLPFLFCYTALGTVYMNMNYGSVFMIYLYIPIGCVGFLIPKETWQYGFGVDLLPAVLIFAAVAAVSVAASFMIARLFYNKSDFKPLPEQVQSVQ